LILSQNKTVEQRKQIIAGLIVESANRDVNADNKDIILVKFPNSKPSSVSYEMASSLIDPQSVPQDLRERVRKSKESQYQYAKIRYQDSILSDALFVGEPIKIPGGGMYEMYVVFALNTQSETLNLIRNSLVFTGFALDSLDRHDHMACSETSSQPSSRRRSNCESIY
jgi:two-component system sensor histidine kinase MtrB